MSTVTVVIPTRNRRAVLLPALGAVLAQRDVALDVVVVDEGSDDGTGEAVAALHEPRVHVVRHPVARGLPAARNAGIRIARGDWIAFCDDDDLWAPTKLAEQLAAARAAGAAWSCTAAVEVDPDLSILGWHRPPPGGIDPVVLSTRNAVPGGGSTVLARRDVVVRLGGFDESLPAAEDWDMWRRLCEVSPPATVDRPLVAYRVWAAGLSRDVGRLDVGAARVVDRGGAREVAGTAFGDREHARYRIKLLLRNGQRWRAAAALVALARAPRQGRLTDVLKAPVALVAPAAYLRAGAARSVRAVPAGWAEEVATWLAPMRGQAADPAA